MSDAEGIVIAFAALYLSDCFAWIPYGATAFAQTSFGRWSVRAAHVDLPSLAGGVLALNPLPPLPTLFISESDPLSFSIDGLVFSSRDGESRFVLYAAIENLHTENDALFLNGMEIATFTSPIRANNMCQFIDRLRQCESSQRETVIDAKLRHALSPLRATRAISLFRGTTLPLRITCNALWCYLFLVYPVAVILLGVSSLSFRLAAGALYLHFVCLYLFWGTHRRLLRADRRGRRNALLTMLLCPPMAIRAVDIIARHAFAAHHPLTIQQVLIGRDRQDMRYHWHAPQLVADSSRDRDVESVRRWYLDRLSQIAGSVLGILPPGAEVAPTIVADPGSVSYCPRCGVQYTRSHGQCADCEAIELAPLRPPHEE